MLLFFISGLFILVYIAWKHTGGVKLLFQA
jgi:hypothetical protein